MNNQFKAEIKQELIQILSWWQVHMIDHNNGGFYGRIDGLNQLHPLADKGIILNTRILWAFSAAANAFPNQAYQKNASRAFRYLTQHFLDQKNGGLYWMLDHHGHPLQTKKQIYAQAFGIYALAEYYSLTKDEQAIKQARELFMLIEKYSKDEQNGGYFEAFSEDWKLLEDLRLSDKDANEAKTMNTHLHILEAYTNFYKVYPHQGLGSALKELIHCFLERFIDQSTYHLHLFFDEQWQLKSDEISFGHDIEASWLLVEAAEVLNDLPLLERVKAVALQIAEATFLAGVGKDGRIFNEATPKGLHDKDSHWWQPAEAVVGFLNAYQLSHNPKFMEAVLLNWQFIKSKIIDTVHGEWHWLIDEAGLPSKTEDKAGPWKAPYHNSRMCLEVIRRWDSLLDFQAY